MCYFRCLSNSIDLIIFGEEKKKKICLLCSFLEPFILFLHPDIFLSTRFSSTLSLYFPLMWFTKFIAIKTAAIISFLYTIIWTVLWGKKCRTKDHLTDKGLSLLQTIHSVTRLRIPKAVLLKVHNLLQSEFSTKLRHSVYSFISHYFIVP